MQRSLLVASPGIEPGSGASETLILSIVLRSHCISAKYFSGCKVIILRRYCSNKYTMLILQLQTNVRNDSRTAQGGR